MNAALVLAAVRHELPRLRYVTGTQRSDQGLVVAGTEQVQDVRTTQATARRRLDEAREFFRHGKFAAVLDVLPDDPNGLFAAAWPEELLHVARQLRPVARFYAAWDRLDFKTADQEQSSLPEASKVAGLWREFIPNAEAVDWVHTLAQPLPAEATIRAGHLRLLAADLLANAERRLRDQHFEDTIIRAYRVLELVGQIRLCDRGIHSDDIPLDRPEVIDFMKKLEKDRSSPLGMVGNKTVASREQVARLLKSFQDPLAKELLKLGNEGAVQARRRNYSALIHGFEATGGNDSAPLQELLDKLSALLQADSPDAEESLRKARSLSFTTK